MNHHLPLLRFIRQMLATGLAVAPLVALSTAPVMAAESPAPAPAPKAAAEGPVRNVNPAQAKPLVDGKKVVIIDLRTPEEFQASHLPGATNINFRSPDFERQIAALPKGRPYLIHCASGNRSGQALPTFRKLQFREIYHLDSGIKGWEKAGMPVER